ncbi:TlpA disulfide reductase family protein [Psychroserpens sp. SPM9]|uniref:TlpA family protein disulfide reductase n=1 Tax=Psychroserpens sp. SPM9 TaxID=2975598 RepID=UPI0021A7B3A2|nr:TlpA disulfide reductase family protein [Psychroserpens sp. SPM9]MDG5491004.1 TlpA disulfide reductase family protein [Psychroserpens sp. SPM9]
MRNLFNLLILAILFTSCQKEESKNITSLTIKTNLDSIASPKLFRPINGILMWDNNVDSLSITNDNMFYGEYNVESPEYVRFLLNKKRHGMILLANQHYTITLEDKDLVFSGDNAKGQQFYHNLDRTPTGAFSFLNRFDGDTTAVLIQHHIDNLKGEEISQIDTLLQEKAIDQPFYELLKNDINYYYANAIFSLADYRKNQVESEYKKRFEDLMISTIENYPYAVANKPYNWNDFVMETQIYPELQSKYSQNQRQDFYAKDSIHPIYISTIKSLIKEPYREDLLANYIINNSKQSNYEQSLVVAFDDFKTDYPNSSFTPYLENDIDIIREYRKKTQSKMPSSVTFVEGEDINSLEDLLKEFEGQKLYIDVWATWCSPCKKEFSNNHMIADILKQNGYKKLFISIDEENRKTKWTELIKYYDLSGYHHLANQAFVKDFGAKYSRIKNGLSIPQYLIVDENGTIVTNNAPRPGAPDEVLKLLN